ncbi:polysaccharide deacetylase family protein [Proteiniclasticum sp.]|uniref:polysaccharide deacetylase family protein n=1 Tax=Proteiniclasticum sp. TaxID=2053595 RepID=UPI00289CBD01|nr:polysaccharide deacetylase family protein [Proteiniclasticum sp.]
MIRRLSFVIFVILIFFAGCMEKEIIRDYIPAVPAVEVRTPIIPNNKEIQDDFPVETVNEENPPEVDLHSLSYENLVTYMEEKYDHRKVRTFGENIEGVYTHLEIEEKVIALTFDACGGNTGSGYDKELIDFLIEEQVPASLFINSRWIRENPKQFRTLAQTDLFEIQNHGHDHKPLSVEGRSVYNIKGTDSIAQVLDEVMKNQNEIFHMTGVKPKYFRSGTAYYDDVSLSMLKELGIKAVNFDLLGDAGAKFNRAQMVSSADQARNGSILLYHMNHPEKAVAEGIKLVVPMLREKGFHFVKLSDYDEYLK